MLVLVALAALPLASGYAGSHNGFAAKRARNQPLVSMVPTELAEAAWLPELQACCALSSATGAEDMNGEQRMGALLEWLQKMLVDLEMGNNGGEEDDDDDELDPDFVNTARPWLHTKAFFDVAAQDFTQTLWEHVSSAEYLQPGDEGGSLLLLLPSRLPLSLFHQVTDAVSEGAATHVNSAVVVTGCHPDAEEAARRSPIPAIQLFVDSPDLLVEVRLQDESEPTLVQTSSEDSHSSPAADRVAPCLMLLPSCERATQRVGIARCRRRAARDLRTWRPR